VDERGNIHLSEGEVSAEARERLERAHREDPAGIEARLRALMGDAEAEVERLREAAG
jgi:hypothetical protein